MDIAAHHATTRLLLAMMPTGDIRTKVDINRMERPQSAGALFQLFHFFLQTANFRVHYRLLPHGDNALSHQTVFKGFDLGSIFLNTCDLCMRDCH
ncbi:MAG: hypothetical protein RLZZ573_941 [Pseudomonadota bacterium]|jgi:hypothetical protein